MMDALQNFQTFKASSSEVTLDHPGKRISLREMATRLLAMSPIGEIESRVVDLPERRER